MISEMIFLRKEFIEIKQSKRLLLSLFFGLIYCVAMNVVATAPGSMPLFSLNLERCLLSANFLVAGLCTDIVFVTMIEEVRYGTFDIMCLGCYKREKIILLKCLSPALISVIVLGAGLLINNIAATMIPQLLYLNGKEIKYWLWALLTSVGCSLFEFLRCINSKTESPTSNNYAVLILSVVYAVLYYKVEDISYWVAFIVAILFATLLYFLIVWKLKYKATARQKIKRKFSVGIKDGNYITSIFSRELKKLLDFKLVLIKMASMLIFSTIFICCFSSKLEKEILIVIVIYSLAMIFSGDVFFNSARKEICEKMEDILLLAGVNKKQNLQISWLFTMLLGMITGLLYFLLYKFCMLQCGEIFCGVRYFVGYIITLLMSGIVTYIFVLKFLKTLKDERLVRRYIYVVTFVIYFLLCLAAS